MRLLDPISLVRQAALPPRSHLQQVLLAELERLGTLPAARAGLPTLHGNSGAFEASLRNQALHQGGAVIAEYKQGSPSLGPFAAGTPLVPQLEAYGRGGAAAFSILVEPVYFRGSAQHLQAARSLGRPLLYKGFVLAEAQLAEAEAAGASAVLLIARVLRDHTASFARAARARGLEPLIELHDLTEVPLAQAAEARLVGINARDLATFTLGEPSAAPLRQAFPEALLIRESGLATPEDACRALHAGFDAVLIGEALMRSADPAGFLGRIFQGLKAPVA